MDTLKVELATALPLREISSLTTRTGSTAKLELLAVGDEDFAVMKAELQDGVPGDTFRYDLFLPLVGTGIDLRGGSGFEGIACDGEGSVYVLQEEESRILVFDRELTQLRHVVWLNVPEDTPGYGSDWYSKNGRNYRAEGLLLLAGGHVLVAKQKLPVYLIEFGPRGESPSGIRPETVVSGSDAFILQGGDESSELVPLASWELASSAAEAITSLNDIAFGDDGRLYVISSEDRVLARLEKRLKPGEKAKATARWSLDEDVPAARSRKPRGWRCCLISRPWLASTPRRRATTSSSWSEASTASSRHGLFLYSMKS